MRKVRGLGGDATPINVGEPMYGKRHLTPARAHRARRPRRLPVPAPTEAVAGEQGFDHYVLKPVDASKLVEIVASRLERSSLP